MTHRVLSLEEAQNFVFRAVTFAEGWETFACYAKTPSENELFNFKVRLQGTDTTLLVLDPYGDDRFEGPMRERFLLEAGERSYLVIDASTGIVYLGYFIEDSGDDPSEEDEHSWKRYALLVTRFEADSDTPSQFIVPPSLLGMLERLLSKKRPYSLTVASEQLLDFIDRETGYREAFKGLTISLDFGDETLELNQGSHRLCSKWRDLSEDPDYPKETS